MPQTIDMSNQQRLTMTQRESLEAELGYIVCGDRRRLRYPTRYLPCLDRLGHSGAHTTVWPGTTAAARQSSQHENMVVMSIPEERTRLEGLLGHQICGVVRRLRNPDRYLPCVAQQGHSGNHRTRVRGIMGNHLSGSDGNALSTVGETAAAPAAPAAPVAVTQASRQAGRVSPEEVAAAESDYCDLCGSRGESSGRQNLGGVHVCWDCLEYPSEEAFNSSCNELADGALCRLRGSHAGPHQFAATY